MNELNDAYFHQRAERFAYWSRSAPISFASMVAIVVLSFDFHTPTVSFMVLNAAAGVAIYFSWHYMLSRRETAGRILLVISLVALFGAIAPVIKLPIAILVSQGLSTAFGSFSFCLLCRQWMRKSNDQ